MNYPTSAITDNQQQRAQTHPLHESCSVNKSRIVVAAQISHLRAKSVSTPFVLLPHSQPRIHSRTLPCQKAEGYYKRDWNKIINLFFLLMYQFMYGQMDGLTGLRNNEKKKDYSHTNQTVIKDTSTPVKQSLPRVHKLHHTKCRSSTSMYRVLENISER